MTLLAEDLLLLLLDDESGALSSSSQVQVALGGAVLADLALAESVTVGERTGLWHTAKVAASGPAPSDPVLAAAHEQVAQKERTAQDLVGRLGKGLKDRLIDDLVARGIVEERKDRVLGVFPRTRWPAVDSSHEDAVRRDLTDTLVHGRDPDPRTAALVALLLALDEVHTTVPTDPTHAVSRRDLKKRAKQVADGEWAAKGVADAIAATNAAVVTAVTVSATSAATTT